MPNLNKDQVKNIIQNRPKDVSPESIINGLIQRGYKLEGLEGEISKQKSLGQQVKEFGVGFLKGAGRSGLNLLETTTGFMPPIGITGGPGIRPDFQKFEEKLQPQTTAEKIGGYVETGVEVLAPLPGGKQVAEESLINTARRWYESALKPSTTLSPAKRLELIKTGLDEGISISQRGLEKLETKINDLESALDEPIKQATQAGKKVTIEFLTPFVDEAKKILGKTADPIFSEKAVQNIEKRFEALKQKFPEGIPIDEAQKMKVATYQLIKNAYGKLKTSTLEYQKQVARGLKEGVLEAAESVGEINKRLGKLYEFEKQFERANNRLRNLNIIGLGTKVLATAGGKVGAGLAIANEIFGALKDISAIQMNKIGKYLSIAPSNEIEALKSVSKILGPVNVNNFFQKMKDLFGEDQKY